MMNNVTMAMIASVEIAILCWGAGLPVDGVFFVGSGCL
jgi:hypothetical protein